MTITLAAFQRKYLGRRVGSGQCRALVTAYESEVLGIRGDTYQAIPRCNAEDMYRLANTAYFRKVRNTPNAIPPIGAIFVMLHKVYGHTGIVNRRSTVHVMYSLDQNWTVERRFTIPVWP